jgi:hypothetical protein
MVKTISDSFKVLLKVPKLILFLYAIGLILAIIVARPFYVTLLNEANNSLALNVLTEKFDFMIFSDFMLQSSKALKPFLPLIFVLLLAYILLNIFFAGGVLKVIDEKSFSFSSFLTSSSGHFFKFLFFLLFSLICLLVILFLLIIVFAIFIKLADGGNERTYALALIIPLLLSFFSVSIVILQADYARIMMYKNENLPAYKAFWPSFGYVLKNPKTLIMFWLILILGLIILLLYYGIDSLIGMKSGMSIAFMFIIQQLFIVVRTFLKTLTTATAFNFYENKPVLFKVKETENIAESPNLASEENV